MTTDDKPTTVLIRPALKAIWVLWDGKDLAPAIDETGDPFLAFRTENEARDAAAEHWQQFALDYTPVKFSIRGGMT